MVLYDRMARHVEHVALSIILETLGTQRHTLIERHVRPNDGRLADDHTRAVVYSKVLANLCPGVNVDAGARVGLLGDDARQHRHLHQVQHMSQTIVSHSVDDGIAVDDLTIISRCRVIVKHRLHVGVQQTLYLGQLVNEP